MMRKQFPLLLCIAGLLFAACEQSDPPAIEQVLVWSDEFEDTALDTSKWEIMLGDGSNYGLWRWGNNEDQYYTANNVSLSNGMLRIRAEADSIAGYGYTSARIRSLNSGDFKYGKVEASIRMDPTAGLWHAFWMLPSNPVDPWPISGEIDIMEYVGNQPNELLTTVHFADAFGNRNQLGSSQPFVNDNAFHLYAMEWDENKITWYQDSTEVYSVLRSNDQIGATWPFDAKFHVLLNTAVGGNLGGAIDVQAMQTPRYMDVEYVRVYQNR